ncbi:MAG: hypothetical protein AAFR61_12295 [Bacteroidota bacterium]
MNFRPGFLAQEAKALLALCNHAQWEGEESPCSHEHLPPLPGHLRILSRIQLAGRELGLVFGQCAPHTYVLVIRGRTYTPLSIERDLEFRTLPARGFAGHEAGQVHAGFKDLLEVLLPQILVCLEKIPAARPFNLYVSGHGQGAALAALTCAFLGQHPFWQTQIRLKSYFFGLPRVGNQYFAEEFDQRFSQSGWSFRICHVRDVVPFLPLGPEVSCFEPSPMTHFLPVGQLISLTSEFPSEENNRDIFAWHGVRRYYRHLSAEYA